MVSTNPAAREPSLTGQPNQPDAESAEWMRLLSEPGTGRDMALVRLHELLVRVAHREVRRRGSTTHVTGPELDDLAYQAAADAMVAVTSKLGQFRGESRFTTWAFKFVMLEVSSNSVGTSGRAPKSRTRPKTGTGSRTRSESTLPTRLRGATSSRHCSAQWTRS